LYIARMYHVNIIQIWLYALIKGFLK